MMSNINVDELKKQINQIKIIDIRNEQSYNNNHINNSKNVPFEKLIVNPSLFMKVGEKYCIYCQKGITSLKACQILSRMGYDVCSLQGGIEEWILKN